MRRPSLPAPRGPITERITSALRGRPGRVDGAVLPCDDPLTGEDTHLALHLCYALHHDGFAGVDEEWEWEPSLLALRRRLERRFIDALLRSLAPLPLVSPERPIGDQLRRLIDEAGGPSLSAHMEQRGTLEQLREFAIHRSVYQRKEADAHTWGIPRLRGRAKSALVQIQADEYGGGARGRTHAELFTTTMAVLDLDPAPGAYVDVVPGATLATDNLVTLFGLHRRWRAALVGHLAVFEMTSVAPMGRYASAIRRLTGSDAAAEFYDVHVLADAEHEVIAANELAGGFVDDQPELAADVLVGAAALLAVEARFAGHLLGSWAAGRSSLLDSRRSARMDEAAVVSLPSR